MDTGSHGAVCIVKFDGDKSERTLVPFKGKDAAGIAKILDDAIAHTKDLQYAVIEEPPRFMGTMIPSSRISVLFESFGFTVGYLMGKGVEVHKVIPKVWQEPYRDAIGFKRGKMKHSEWKKNLSKYAKLHHPTDGLTNETADALLMSQYWLKHRPHTNE